MIKRILIGSAAVIALSSSAFAADAIYEAPAAPPMAVETAPVFSWAGGYAGILTGYGWGDGDWVQYLDNPRLANIAAMAVNKLVQAHVMAGGNWHCLDYRP